MRAFQSNIYLVRIMAKVDFKEGTEKLNEYGIIKACADFYMEPKRRGSNFFVKSPESSDRTWSCCLYPANNRFCDFANGNKSGDIVGFYAYIKGLNQWKALQELSAYYGLSGGKHDKEEARRRIQRQQQEERKKADRKREFYNALFSEIEDLKSRLGKYRLVIEKGEIEPLSDLWCYVLDEIQRTEYRLDILTATDMGTYRRLKPNLDLGLSSDRPAWLLDCLSVLQEIGAFYATQGELEEIRAQHRFEMCGRKPGADRRCCISW